MNASIGQYKGYLVSALARPLGEAIEARFKLGDDTVLDEYVGWLGQREIENIDRDTARIFAPMIEHGDLPAIKAAARKAFTAPGSPWNLAEIAMKETGGEQCRIDGHQPDPRPRPRAGDGGQDPERPNLDRPNVDGGQDDDDVARPRQLRSGAARR